MTGDAPRPSASADADGITLLAEALATYLHEVQTSAEVCRGHEATTAVRGGRHVLSTRQTFPSREATAKQLRSAAGALPPWEESLWWSAYGGKWDRLTRAACAPGGADGTACPLVRRGVAWEGYPVRIHAAPTASGGTFTVRLDFPTVPSELPELPLVLLARALRCHEQLVLGAVAQPLFPFLKRETGWLSVREFLQRTMPENLYASQCILRGTEATSPNWLSPAP